MNRGVFPFTLSTLDVTLSNVFLIRVTEHNPGAEGCLLGFWYEEEYCSEGKLLLSNVCLRISEFPAETEVWISAQMVLWD